MTPNGDHFDMAFDHDGATTPTRRVRTHSHNVLCSRIDYSQNFLTLHGHSTVMKVNDITFFNLSPVCLINEFNFQRTYTTNLDVVLSDRRRSSALSNISALTGNGSAPTSAAANAAAGSRRPRFNTSQSMPPLGQQTEAEEEKQDERKQNGQGAVDVSAV